MIIIFESELVKFNELFNVTRNIEDILLFDDINKKICFPNHKQYSPYCTGHEYYDFSSIKSAKLVENTKDTGIRKLGTIYVLVEFKDRPYKIIYLTNEPIPTENDSFRKKRTLSEQIIDSIQSL